MKTTLLYLTILLFLALGSSCKKDNDPDSNLNYFYCKIDGEDYRINGNGAFAIDFGNYVIIYGVDTDNFTVYLQVEKINLSLGTHTFDDDTFGYVIPEDPGAAGFTTFVGNGSGTITLTKVEDNRYEGNFQFNAFDFGDSNIGTVITAGNFGVTER